MHCPTCSLEFESKFCPGCGGGASATGMTDNLAGALCYLAGLVTGILFLVLAPYNQRPEIRFHAFQSILFHVAWVGLIIAEMLLGVMLPFALSMILSFAGLLIGVGGFGVWLYLMWCAYQNQPLVLPVLGAIARQQSKWSGR